MKLLLSLGMLARLESFRGCVSLWSSCRCGVPATTVEIVQAVGVERIRLVYDQIAVRQM